MASSATWLMVIGIVLLVTGVVLRTIVMMRSSDASAPEANALHGRELVSQYRRLFPKSLAPLITRWLLISGTVLLLAGLSVEFSH
jgi:uncharacterized membrane protein HdeD (DUF308 family)